MGKERGERGKTASTLYRPMLWIWVGGRPNIALVKLR